MPNLFGSNSDSDRFYEAVLLEDIPDLMKGNGDYYSNLGYILGSFALIIGGAFRLIGAFVGAALSTVANIAIAPFSMLIDEGRRGELFFPATDMLKQSAKGLLNIAEGVVAIPLLTASLFTAPAYKFVELIEVPSILSKSKPPPIAPIAKTPTSINFKDNPLNKTENNTKHRDFVVGKRLENVNTKIP